MGSTCRTIYFLIVALAFFIGIHGKRNFEIVLEAFNCTVNPKYASESNCYIDKTLKEPRGFAQVQLCREIPQVNYSMRVVLSRGKLDKITLLNIDNEDACPFLKGDNNMPIVKIYRDVLLDAGELPKCPIGKDFRFVFKDLKVDAEKFPPYVPEAKFTLTLLSTIGKEFVLWAQLDGSAVQKHRMKPLTLG